MSARRLLARSGQSAPAAVPCARRAEIRSTPQHLAPTHEIATVLHTAGRPLDGSTRHAMEARFGHDFGQVRVHDDARAQRSAMQIAARAYTVGEHIVFGSGQSPAATQLLAHELAHVVQQRTPGSAQSDTTRLEAEANRAARTASANRPTTPRAAIQREHTTTDPRVARGERPRDRDARPMASRDLSPTAPRLARDAVSDAEAERNATAAEAACDFATLCPLSMHAPGVVSRARVLDAFLRCHPGVSPTQLVGGNPCLTPNFGRPSPPPPRPGTTPAAPARGRRGAGGGLALPSTTIRFNLGPASVSVDLPASLAVRLPIPFRGATQVALALNASPTEFSFGVTINSIPHVRIGAEARVTTAGAGSAGLTIQTTRTVCRAVDPATARSSLQRAGERLHGAIAAVQNPPAPAADASELERTFAPHARLADVVSALANVHETVERVRAPCREVPVATFRFGVQGPLTTPEPGSRPPASFVGGSLELRF
ncbi:MAG: DUF4157 domain-containing protein [Thiotrichales bacterium]